MEKKWALTITRVKEIKGKEKKNSDISRHNKNKSLSLKKRSHLKPLLSHFNYLKVTTCSLLSGEYFLFDLVFIKINNKLNFFKKIKSKPVQTDRFRSNFKIKTNLN